jgi:uroporphyrinogen-III decarboxylase
MEIYMTTKERITEALMGEMPDRVPFTTYRGVVTAEEGFDNLIAKGLGFIASCGVYNAKQNNLEVTQKDEESGGIATKLVTYKTPVGEIQQRFRTESGYGSSWRIEHFVKDVNDYHVLEYIIRNTEYSPNYEAYRQAERNMGENGVLMVGINRVPIQRLWILYTGIERLSIDLSENLSIVEKVMEAMMDEARKLWKIVAESPAQFVWCPDNITGVMTGPPLFDKYCVPYYNEVSDIMHRNGKRVLCHMDGMMSRLRDSVSKTNLDIIEAFTPPPDGDLPLAEAFKFWEGKVISINFPSSVHIAKPEVIRDTTIKLLQEAAPGKAFVMGVTENIPKSVGTQSLSIIADTINEYGSCPINL